MDFLTVTLDFRKVQWDLVIILNRLFSKKELLMEMSSCRLSKSLENSLFSLLNLVFEVYALLVLNEKPLLVPHVSLPDQLVFFLSFIDALVSCLVAHSIEFLGAICSCDHVNDSVVPIVSDLLSGDSHIIHDCLPLSIGHISFAVHQTSVDQNHHVSFLVLHRHLSDVGELVLKSHLKSHQSFLEA